MGIQGRTARALRVAVAVTGLGLAACAGTGEPEVPPPPEILPNEFAGAPGWVIQGCAAYPGGDGRERICGVGSSGGSSNVSMMRKAAVARARTEIARSLAVKVQSMLEDYRTTKAGARELGTGPADEQHVAELSKQITNFTLSGTEHRDTWISNNGTWYALVVLDLDKFEDSLAKMNNLSESVRKAIQERAAASFGESDDESAQNDRE